MSSPTWDTPRQFPRFRLQNIERASLTFALHDKEDGLMRPLFNLSYKGLGFHPEPGDERRLALQLEMPAELRLDQELIRVRVEIVYMTPEIAGARIRPENASDVRKIIRFLTALELGASLAPAPSPNLRQINPDRLLSWYVGHNNTELALWRDRRGNLLEFRMVFLLHAVSGSINDESLRTTDINPAELGYMPLYEPWPEDVAQWQEPPDLETLHLAADLLSNAAQLAPRDQEEITTWILSAHR